MVYLHSLSDIRFIKHWSHVDPKSMFNMLISFTEISMGIMIGIIVFITCLSLYQLDKHEEIHYPYQDTYRQGNHNNRRRLH